MALRESPRIDPVLPRRHGSSGGRARRRRSLAPRPFGGPGARASPEPLDRGAVLGVCCALAIGAVARPEPCPTTRRRAPGPTGGARAAAAMHGAGAGRLVAGARPGHPALGRAARRARVRRRARRLAGTGHALRRPDDLARGDEADVVATLGRAAAPVERVERRPAALGGAPGRRCARAGRWTSSSCDAPRGCSAWIDRDAGARPRRGSTPRSRRTSGRWRARSSSARAISRRTTTGRSARAGCRTCWPCPGCTWCSCWRSSVRTLEGLLVRVEVARGAARRRARRAAHRRARWRGCTRSWPGPAARRCARRGWRRPSCSRARWDGAPTRRARSGSRSRRWRSSTRSSSFDLSFLLSAGATAGLAAFARPFGRAARGVGSREARVASPRATATTLAASVPCVPILARFAPTVPLGGVLANLLAVPVGETVALPCASRTPRSRGGPRPSGVCASVATGALVLVRAVARGFAVPGPHRGRPAAHVVAARGRSRSTLAALVLGTRVRAWGSPRPRSILVLEIGARRAGVPHGVLRATFLDVGQGDSAIVDLPDGEALVIDGGGLVGSPIDVGMRVLAPELRARRRRSARGRRAHAPSPGPLQRPRDGARRGARRAPSGTPGRARRRARARRTRRCWRGCGRRGVPVLRPDALCGAHDDGRGARRGARAVPRLRPRPRPERQLVRPAHLLRRAVAPPRRRHRARGGGEPARAATATACAPTSSRSATTAAARPRTPAFLAAVAPRRRSSRPAAATASATPHPQTLATARRRQAPASGAPTATARSPSTTDGRALEVDAARGRDR